ncbi:MAG TPA: MFS transporter [Vicinamibacterales bacterium]|nr:MFS transporter [Vicinamibacterales bacterium]
MRSRATSDPDSAESAPLGDGTPSLWRPLRTPIFRNLLIADVMSDIGTFMQTVGAAWLMVSLGAGPMYVALTQTASALPFFVFALPAGAIGDIVDRRRLILYTEFWMVGVATVLAVATIMGLISPWLLLVLTFALSAGDAIETPTWRAILPEMVKKEDLAAASALNGIEFNFARAVGPALAGVIIAVAGVGPAFALNVVSFAGVIVLVARWKRPVRRRTTPPETLAGATVAALRYVRFSPSIRVLILRSGLTMFFASALLALMPSVAKSISDSPTGYGILLGCFGAGAVLGALTMQPARARWSEDAVASGGVAILGLMTAIAGFLHAMVALAATMLVAGAAWIVFISVMSALVQSLAPDWVRARVLSIFMLVFQGGLAAGSALSGALAARAGIQHALLWAGIGIMATTALGLVAKLPDATTDVSPWIHWRMPAIVKDVRPELDEGPVLVTLEYRVNRDQSQEFLDAIHEYGRVRRRDGAYRWGVYRDLEDADRYVETFLIRSWAEHLRQHERSTKADREVEDRLRTYVTGVPKVRHLVAAESDR